MKVFAQKLAKLFAHDLPFNVDSEIPIYVKLDTVCRFVAHLLKASSVSILLYSGKEDKVFCRGRYINSENIITPPTPSPQLKEILEKICVFSYINSVKKMKKKGIISDIYSDYNKSVLAGGKVSKSYFQSTFGNYTQWEKTYEKYINIITTESYEIDYSTLTGSYYKKFLRCEPEYEPSIKVRDISKLMSKKYFYIMRLKNELQLTIDAKYYVALPLFANCHYFGVLRLLFPNSKIFQKTPDDIIRISHEERKQFEYIAQLISLHLENTYILRGYNKTYFSSKKHIEQFKTKKRFLDTQCEKLSEIIESKGAIIRLWNKEKGETAIVGYSKSMENYIRTAIDEGGRVKYFEEVVENMQKKQNILGIHFNSARSPFEVYQYIGHENKEYLSYKFEEWPLHEVFKTNVLDTLQNMDIYNIAILPIPEIEKSYIIFLNSKNRNFFSKDIEMIYPAVRNLGLELNSYYYTRRIQNRMQAISRMHEEITRIITAEQLEINEYVREFLRILAKTISGMEVFTHHITWEYVSEEVPDEFKMEDLFFFRNITHVDYNDAPFRAVQTPVYLKNAFYRIEGKDAGWDYDTYFGSEKLKGIFNLAFKEDFLYFDLPFYNYNVPKEDKPRIVGIFTLIYKKSNQQMIEDPDFVQSMYFLSKQISLAWENLMENIATKTQRKIDQHIRENRKDGFASKEWELTEVAKILAEDFSSDLCCFFLFNQSANSLDHAASNISIKQKLSYHLERDKHLLSVQSFRKNENFRIFGRQRVERIVDSEKLKVIEEEIKAPILMKFKDRWDDFQYNEICIEHWLSQVITIGEQKLGLIKLSQTKGIPDALEDSRFDYIRHPFSEFETTLLQRIQKHIFNILVTHRTIQQRIEDMRNVLHQVVAPLTALGIQCSNLEKGIVPLDKLYDKYNYIKIQSRIAVKHARNFQKILDIDTGKVSLNKTRILDLRKYLIDKAIDFHAQAKEKGITIHVIGVGREIVSLDVDIDLFDQVINNLIDNAVKYSFDEDGRAEMGMKRKLTAYPDEKGNIILSAREKEGAVVILVSNWGIDIPEDERDQIYNREFRGEKAKDYSPSGTGIGLFLAKEIVEMHGGILELLTDTDPNNVKFRVKFPKEK